MENPTKNSESKKGIEEEIEELYRQVQEVTGKIYRYRHEKNTWGNYGGSHQWDDMAARQQEYVASHLNRQEVKDILRVRLDYLLGMAQNEIKQ